MPRTTRKDDLQLAHARRPAVGRGLLTAEGEAWRLQRRTVAPLFAPRRVAGYLAPMAASVDEMLVALARPCTIRRTTIDVAREMTRVTLRHHLAHGVQSRDRDAGRGDGRGDHDLFRGARAASIPSTLFGLPEWLPRSGRSSAPGPRRAFSARRCAAMLAARRARILAQGEPAAGRSRDAADRGARSRNRARRLPTRDPRQLVTFIGAGHETTANALSVVLVSCLSESPRRCGRGSRPRHTRSRPCPTAGARRCAAAARLRHGTILEEAMRLYPPVPFMSRGRSARPARRCSSPGQLDHRSRPGCFIGTAGSGTMPTPSCRRASCRSGATASRASPICRSAPGRGSASARPSRFKRRDRAAR